MDDASIDEVLDALHQYDAGCWWVETIPGKMFHGEPIDLEIDTQSPTMVSSPRPSEDELKLARSILRSIDTIIAVAEGEFDSYHAKYLEEARSTIDAPGIWISRETILEEGPERWTFVVSRSDWEDYGYHIEFNSVELVESWAGD